MAVTHTHWRVGHQSPRVLYRGTERVGIMDDAQLAMQVVAAVNASPDILAELRKLHEQGEQIMTTVQELRADFDQYKTDVTDAFARLQASIDAALANQGGIPADVQAAIDDMDVAVKGADADAVAEDPAAPPA